MGVGRSAAGGPLWLRPSNTRCDNNVTAFFLDLWGNLPRHLRLKGVRADSGFCLAELLELWEQLKLPYVVVAQLNQPIQTRIMGDLKWTETEVPGTEVVELGHHPLRCRTAVADGVTPVGQPL